VGLIWREPLAEARVSFVRTNLKEAEGKRTVVTNRNRMRLTRLGNAALDAEAQNPIVNLVGIFCMTVWNINVLPWEVLYLAAKRVVTVTCYTGYKKSAEGIRRMKIPKA
jgi:hypothetical protein